MVTQRIVSTDTYYDCLRFIRIVHATEGRGIIVKLAIKSAVGFFPQHSYLPSDERDEFARVEDQEDNSLDRDNRMNTISSL